MVKRILAILSVLAALQGNVMAAEQIRFNESVLPYQDGYLIPNFGTQEKFRLRNRRTDIYCIMIIAQRY